MQTKRVGSPTRRSIASETGSLWQQQLEAWHGARGAEGEAQEVPASLFAYSSGEGGAWPTAH